MNKMNKTEKISIGRSKSGLPTISVGGGAYTNTCRARFVIDKKRRLKKGIFLRKSGPLACELDQAIVPLHKGDIVVEWDTAYIDEVSREGFEVGEFTPKAYEVIDFEESKAIVRQTSISFDDIPASVIKGSMSYHNRDGSYFARFDNEE